MAITGTVIHGTAKVDHHRLDPWHWFNVPLRQIRIQRQILLTSSSYYVNPIITVKVVSMSSYYAGSFSLNEFLMILSKLHTRPC